MLNDLQGTRGLCLDASLSKVQDESNLGEMLNHILSYCKL
jgi:hypothetical protein